MEKDIVKKIQNILNSSEEINENQIRSLMILVRKRLELMVDTDKLKYLTLNLFCNWVAHTTISRSMIGFKTLAKVNDALVNVKGSKDIEEVRLIVTKAVGFDTLHLEFVSFLKEMNIQHLLLNRGNWKAFLNNLIELIRDVPLKFPPINTLKKGATIIYNQIAKNPIKPGAGVISITIAKVDYGPILKTGQNEILCLIILVEDTTKLVVPLMF